MGTEYFGDTKEEDRRVAPEELARLWPMRRPWGSRIQRGGRAQANNTVKTRHCALLMKPHSGSGMSVPEACVSQSCVISRMTQAF